MERHGEKSLAVVLLRSRDDPMIGKTRGEE
jgi:hypothetical protein